MKLKIFAKILEKLLGVSLGQNEPRADMFLPLKLLSFSMVLFAAGIACGVWAVFSAAVWAIIGAILGLVLSFFAFICWKNQTIRMISDQQFVYTTMFGNEKTYSFSEIRSLKKNQDSLTLFVGEDKVHIESMAIMTERLAERLNRALANTDD